MRDCRVAEGYGRNICGSGNRADADATLDASRACEPESDQLREPTTLHLFRRARIATRGLHTRGTPIRVIVRELGVNRATVSKYVR